MQEHFNENYLESDLYPISTFVGKVLEINRNQAEVQGDLEIHGIKNQIAVVGSLMMNEGFVYIKSNFSINLEDYNIKIPKIVMYKIAEVIDVKVNIKLKEIKWGF